MKGKFKKAVSLVSAIAMSAVAVSAVLPAYAEKKTETSAENTVFPYTIEGEDMEGADLWTSIYETQLPGYSGEGFAYLTGGT